MNLSHKFYKEISRFSLTLSISGAIVLGSNAHSMDAPFQCPSEAEVKEYINNLKKYSNFRNFKTEMGFIFTSKNGGKNWELLNSPDSLFDDPTGFQNTYKYPTDFSKVRLSQADNQGKICEYQAQRSRLGSISSEVPFTFREYTEIGSLPIFPETETESIDIEVEAPSFAPSPGSGIGVIESDSIESNEMPSIGVPLYEPDPNITGGQDTFEPQLNVEEEGTFEPLPDVEEQDIFIPQPGEMQETIIEDTFRPQPDADALGLQPENEPAQSSNMPGLEDQLPFEPQPLTASEEDEEYGDWEIVTGENDPADKPSSWRNWKGWIPFSGK